MHIKIAASEALLMCAPLICIVLQRTLAPLSLACNLFYAPIGNNLRCGYCVVVCLCVCLLTRRWGCGEKTARRQIKSSNLSSNLEQQKPFCPTLRSRHAHAQMPFLQLFRVRGATKSNKT